MWSTQLRDDIDACVRRRRRHPPAPTRAPDTSPWYVPLALDAGYELDPLAGVFLLLGRRGVRRGLAPLLPRLRGALQASGVTDLIRDYLGETPVLSLNKTVLRQHRRRGRRPTWHQDGCYLGVGIRAVDLWVSLSRCGGDTDVMGLDILPRPMDDLAEMGGYDAIDPRAVSQHVVDRAVSRSGRPDRTTAGSSLATGSCSIPSSSTDPTSASSLASRYAIESWWFGAVDLSRQPGPPGGGLITHPRTAPLRPCGRRGRRR